MRNNTIYEKVEDGFGGFKFITLKSGKKISFRDAETEAERADSNLARAMSRMFKLAANDSEPEITEYHLDKIGYFLDSLETYIGAMRHELKRRRGIEETRKRIALLRDTTGRTPEEAKAFTQKADELEQRLKEAR